jgi:lysophospholipase L1-like esterase
MLAGAVLIALAWWYIAPQNTSIANYPSHGTDIIAFGDSLVAGEGSDSGKDFVSLLSEQIGKPIINLGVSGNTTAQGLARIGDIDGYQPKVVLLLLGGNDYLQHVDPATTFSNLSQIIEHIQSHGAIVLLLGIRGGVLSDPFKSQFERLRDQYHTAYVSDVLGGLFGNSDLMSDEVHPNDQGYALIANRIYPVLDSLLN